MLKADIYYHNLNFIKDSQKGEIACSRCKKTIDTGMGYYNCAIDFDKENYHVKCMDNLKFRHGISPV